MAYFGIRTPNDNQLGSYNRQQLPIVTSIPLAVTWGFDVAPSPLPRVRLTLDRSPITAWLTAPPYTVTIDKPTGDYLMGAEIEGNPATVTVLEVPLTVVRELNPVPQTKVWVVPARWEYDFKNLGPGSAQVNVPAAPIVPVSTPTPPRAFAPYREVLTQAQMWNTRTGFFDAGYPRQLHETLVKVGTGRVPRITAYANKQHYLNSTADTSQVTRIPIQDGNRNHMSPGWISSVKVRNGGKSWAGVSSNGRAWEWHWDGRFITVAGIRQKANRWNPDWTTGMNANSGQPGAAVLDKAWHDDHYEMLGNWLRCTPGLFEPWGYEIRMHPESHGDHVHVEHENWATRRFKHSIVGINHWTAHPADHPDGYLLPAWMPNWYQAPAAPTGKTDVVMVFGETEQPVPACNQPWDCIGGWNAANPIDDRLYWSNLGNHSIAAGNLKTGQMEVVFASPTIPTEAELDSTKPDALRAKYRLEGRFGEAYILRPQGLRFFSDGRMLVVSHSTKTFHIVDFRTKTVTLWLHGPADNKLPYDPGAVDTAIQQSNNFSIDIDWRGECGPVDDVFAVRFAAGSDKRFAKDGLSRGGIMRGTGAMCTGPVPYCGAPGYPTAVSARTGLIVMADQGAARFFVMTKKLATDPVPDVAKYNRGIDAWRMGTKPAMALTHGARGQGRFGLPTWDEMSTWTNQRVIDYLKANGMNDIQAADTLYCIRWESPAASSTVTRTVSDSVAADIHDH